MTIAEETADEVRNVGFHVSFIGGLPVKGVKVGICVVVLMGGVRDGV